MSHKGIVFDLDGTLLDTLDDIMYAANAVMEQSGFPQHDKQAIRSFVGSGLRSLMKRALPERERTAEMVGHCFGQMMEVYRANYKNKTVPYPGIVALLDVLRGKGIPMVVFSNKADELTRKLVEAILPGYFLAVQGMTTEELKKPNPKVAIELAEKMGLRPEECLYVGDSDTDMLTANNAGMYGVGVTWGFRDRENLVAGGAKLLVEEPAEIMKLF